MSAILKKNDRIIVLKDLHIVGPLGLGDIGGVIKVGSKGTVVEIFDKKRTPMQFAFKVRWDNPVVDYEETTLNFESIEINWKKLD